MSCIILNLRLRIINNQNWNEKYGGVLKNNIVVIGGGAIDMEGSIMGSSSGSERSFQGHKNETKTSIVLFLGDADRFDEFVLDIYLDPLYHTFVFDVKSGISSCPFEGDPLTINAGPENPCS